MTGGAITGSFGATTVPRPVPDPQLRVFVFHHAGGSHLPYRDWPAYFPVDWEVRLLDAPGRGRLSGRPVCTDVDALVNVFRDELLLVLDRPFAFFGHSMGGLVAYELTARLAAEGLPLPVWLGLSARGAPRPEGEGFNRHELPDSELREQLLEMGGTPPEILADPELWALLSPMIRGDLRLVETWRPRPDSRPVPVPLTVFGADRDVVVAPERLYAWRQHARHWRGTHIFPGDHFYFRDRPGELIAVAVDQIRAALAQAR
jgi:surfactin synthase thioesterase subunit